MHQNGLKWSGKAKIGYIRGTNAFDKRYVSAKGEQSAVPKIVGQRLLRIYEHKKVG